MPEGSIAETIANGGLAFQLPEAPQPMALPAADISLNVLINAPDCPDNNGGNNSGGNNNGGNNSGGNIVTGDLTPLSCNGTRVWGPSTGQGSELIYISESNGSTVNGAAPRDCAIFWRFDTAQRCATATNIADTATAGVNEEGSLEFRISDSGNVSVFELGVGDLSYQELTAFPSCP